MINQVASTVVQGIVSDVMAWGELGVETGGFILAYARSGIGDKLALCGSSGISRRPDQFIISGEALAVLFEYADRHGFLVACQVHSHQFGPRLSEVDRRFGLTVEGFTSVVVPYWSKGAAEPGAWGWWVYNRGRWLASAVPTKVNLGSKTVVFDEAGVVDG